jgi:hypothetical protein
MSRRSERLSKLAVKQEEAKKIDIVKPKPTKTKGKTKKEQAEPVVTASTGL